MGRSGSSGGGSRGSSSSRSSGGFSSSRSGRGFSSSSSSHRSGSGGVSHRTGSSNYSSGGGLFGSRPSYTHRPPSPHPPPPPPRVTHVTNYYSGGYHHRGYAYRSSHGSGVSRLGALLLTAILILVIFFYYAPSASRGVPKSTFSRERLTGYSYITDCVNDETGELVSEVTTERQLKKFFDDTGVQPYVWFKGYQSNEDPGRMNTESRIAVANSYFDENRIVENAYLVVFFQDSAGDYNLDYTVTITGKEAESVMDAEAGDIFEAFANRYWYGDGSTDSVVVNTFLKTGERIMTKTTTYLDVMKIGAICALVIVVFLVVVRIMKIRRENERERAEETAKILETPLDKIPDPTLDKYE